MALDLCSPAEIILTKLQTSHPNEAVRNLFEWLSDQAEKRFAESLVESEGFLLTFIHLAFGQYLLLTRSVTDGRRQIGGRLSGVCLPLSPRVPVCLLKRAIFQRRVYLSQSAQSSRYETRRMQPYAQQDLVPPDQASTTSRSAR